MFTSAYNEDSPEKEKTSRGINHWALVSENPSHFKNIIGQSKAIKDVFLLIEKVAGKDCTVLINGHTGTGKGLVARAIHDQSKRDKMPFVQINCGAIPENLLESELFGHVKGAFTGATSTQIGKFERANGGTVFLDEIGDMSPDLQVKVLKVLEEGEFEPVGGSRNIKVDIRVIAATHKDLNKEVLNGNFREDLFYRLDVVPITIPSLAERISDVPQLAEYFLNYFNLKNDTAVEEISKDAMDMMMSYPWPGNVRELRNIVERLTVLNGFGTILPEHLPERIRNGGSHLANHFLNASDNIIYLNTDPKKIKKSLMRTILQKIGLEKILICGDVIARS